ncbi:MAG: AMP-binding protein, partial [bacterium]|nr:AMP-binding protein [bacterium]
NLDLTEEDRVVLVSSFAFDLGYTAVFPPIMKGGQLHLATRETYLVPETLLDYIEEQGITYIKITPSFFKAIVEAPAFSPEKCQGLRLVVMGGEAINLSAVEKAHKTCKHIRFMNHYGPSETTIGSVAQFIDFSRWEQYKARPTIGKPIDNTSVYILDKDLNILPVGVAGELCISGAGVAAGYLKREQLTAEKFIDNTFDYANLHSEAIFGKVYRTGDLARWLPGGDIEFLGRFDHQVKIRGYRIELGEIEKRLLKNEEIKETVVTVIENHDGDKLIAAYIVPVVPADEAPLATEDVRKYLLEYLPDYMIPSYFIPLEKMPLNPNGKIDRKALPDPLTMIAQLTFEEPENPVENKLAEIWADVLRVEKNSISRNRNFFELGGHSLKAISLISKIHKEMDVKLPLGDIFRTPTIKGLAGFLEKAAEDKYIAIQPADEKEYYPLSSAQKRLYILQQIDKESTVYNLPQLIPLGNEVDMQGLQETFDKLIKRHDSLRTSFRLVDDIPVQQVHRNVTFTIDYRDTMDREKIVRHFDLDRAPLMRAEVIKNEETYVLAVDMHHIIADGISLRILTQDFMALINGDDLPPLRLQYKDFSEWEHQLNASGSLKLQEDYWLKRFEGEAPVLNMPTDFPRPDIQSFEGDTYSFRIGSQLEEKVKKIMTEAEVTLHILFMTAYYILLAKYTGQTDIVIGSPIAGRTHADLLNIIGMFVNMLAMRNRPTGDKTFKLFLEEVKHNALDAYENQDYQFDALVEKLDVRVARNRHPLVQTVFLLQNLDAEGRETGPDEQTGNSGDTGDTVNPYELDVNISKFELKLAAFERKGGLNFVFEYHSKLFKKETIQRMSKHFINILEEIAANQDIKISKIELLSKDEKELLVNKIRNKAEILTTDRRNSQKNQEDSGITEGDFDL